MAKLTELERQLHRNQIGRTQTAKNFSRVAEYVLQTTSHVLDGKINN